MAEVVQDLDIEVELKDNTIKFLDDNLRISNEKKTIGKMSLTDAGYTEFGTLQRLILETKSREIKFENNTKKNHNKRKQKF